MDVFTGQMTAEVSKIFEESNTLVTNVPPNMTKFYQPLDLTVNGSAKRFMGKKFNGWYSDQITQQLESGKSLEDVDVKLRLSILKPIHAEWVVDFYNYMTSDDGKKVIENGWLASGIADAVRLGLKELPTLDLFSDIDPIMDEDLTVEINLNAMCSLAPDEIEGYQDALRKIMTAIVTNRNAQSEMHSTSLKTLTMKKNCKFQQLFCL